MQVKLAVQALTAVFILSVASNVLSVCLPSLYAIASQLLRCFPSKCPRSTLHLCIELVLDCGLQQPDGGSSMTPCVQFAVTLGSIGLAAFIAVNVLGLDLDEILDAAKVKKQ